MSDEKPFFSWGNIGSIGGLCLAAYLLLVSATALLGLAIPGWVGALFAGAAGVLILVGR